MEIKDEDLIHQLENNKMSSKFTLPVFIAILIASLVLGTGIGYVASGSTNNNTGSSDKTGGSSSKKTAGVLDKKKFPDKAEGKLKDGGIEGEGSFHLERPGGESQNVYLTSSIVDLSQYIGKKVRVWGETQKAQKAGWLMDVGYIEVL